MDNSECICYLNNVVCFYYCNNTTGPVFVTRYGMTDITSIVAETVSRAHQGKKRTLVLIEIEIVPRNSFNQYSPSFVSPLFITFYPPFFSSICSECFNAGDHNGHDFIFEVSNLHI